MILAGGILLGLWIAMSMKKRVDELKQIERIINYLEGEIRYKNSLLGEACIAASLRCGQPFKLWLEKIASELENDYAYSFSDIWEKSIEELRDKSHLRKTDIIELVAVGQTLGYLDVKAQQMGMALEKENIHNTIKSLESGLANNMKIAVILGTLGGIFLVVVLA